MISYVVKGGVKFRGETQTRLNHEYSVVHKDECFDASVKLTTDCLYVLTALEYHNLNTSIGTRDFWVITGKDSALFCSLSPFPFPGDQTLTRCLGLQRLIPMYKATFLVRSL